MAYELWDGFDNYSAATELWPAINGTMSYSPTYARYAGIAGFLNQGLKMASSGAQWKMWNLSGNLPVVIWQFAVLFPTLPNSGGFGAFMQYLDSGNYQCELGVNSAGQLILYSGDGPLFGGTIQAQSAPGVIAANTWYGVGIQIQFANGTGSISVYLNEIAGGAPVMSATGIITETSGNAWCNQFRIGDMGAVFGGIQFDDFHCHNASGAAPNSILGDSRIYTKKGNAAGYATNWTPNGASANWQCSDDSPPDGDTTYNSSNTPGAVDAYSVPPIVWPIGFNNVPHGIVRRSYVRRDDAGPHTFQNGIRSGSTNGLGNAFTVPAAYAWTDCGICYANDPATGLPWLTAAADAASMIIDETS